MCIDPPDASSAQPAQPDELNDFVVGNERSLIHQLVSSQQMTAPATIANQEFAEHERMSADVATSEQVGKTGLIRRAARKKPDPD